ncbi:MAG: hypothetical protein WAT23_19445 [Chromatiaceae bacterium]
MRYTVKQAKAISSGITSATGIIGCSPQFLERLSQAEVLLSQMGKWWGTYRRLWVCSSSDCVVWPRGVAVPLGLSVGGSGVRIHNEWYEFGDEVKAPSTDDTDPTIAYDRPSVCHNTASPYPTWKLRLYPSVASDAGAKVIAQGYDDNGLVIRSQASDSAFIIGEELVLAAPFVDSTFTFAGSWLTGVQKPITNGRVLAYAVSPAGDETQIGTWEASEENPSYRRSFIPGINSRTCTSTPCATTGCDPAPTCTGRVFDAIVRMEPVPLLHDSDWLFLGNLGAYSAAIKSIIARDNGQYQAAEIELETAKRLLRNELETYDPAARTVVRSHPHGTAKLNRVLGGFI